MTVEHSANAKKVAVPKLLVSVRNATEVMAALAGGADWIDLKEPNAGPLAAVEASVAEEAAQELAGRRTLSAALGELRDWGDSPAQRLLETMGIEVVKLGLAGCAGLDDWQQQWLLVADAAEKAGKQLVAVIYADWEHVAAPSPSEILALAQEHSCQYLLIDTYDKGRGTTFDHFSRQELEEILAAAELVGLTTVLAGSITRERLEQIPFARVDMVAVRGAVCCGDRTESIASELVEDFRQSLQFRYRNKSLQP